nr:MAG TPA: hypothetical protein [Caudoviricetes sp.]
MQYFFQIFFSSLFKSLQRLSTPFILYIFSLDVIRSRQKSGAFFYG